MNKNTHFYHIDDHIDDIHIDDCFSKVKACSTKSYSRYLAKIKKWENKIVQQYNVDTENFRAFYRKKCC